MFRQGVSQSRLDAWKQKLLEGSATLPGWIRDNVALANRAEVINGLTVDDVFRSQFRAKSDADESTPEVLEMGLRHIDRLRQSGQESKQLVVLGRQVWAAIILGGLGLFVGVANIIVTWLTRAKP